MRRTNILITLSILLAILTACRTQEAGGLTVTGVWARPGEAGGNSAVYFTVENGTGTDDVMKSARSQAGKAVEIHRSMMDENGVMSMSPQDSVPVPAGERVEFIPGGYHVMLIDLPHDLEVSDTFSMTLTFENAGEVNVEVEVREP